jgi:hypothetical protein
MTNEKFFVGVKNPVDVRRDLLNSSKTIINSLIKYEQYRDLREQKLKQVEALKKVMDDLVFLNRKLRTHLPKMKASPTPRGEIDHKHPGFPPKPAPEKVETPLKQVVKKERTPKKTRLEQLKDELSRFENKLSEIE